MDNRPDDAHSPHVRRGSAPDAAEDRRYAGDKRPGSAVVMEDAGAGDDPRVRRGAGPYPVGVPVSVEETRPGRPVVMQNRRATVACPVVTQSPDVGRGGGPDAVNGLGCPARGARPGATVAI